MALVNTLVEVRETWRYWMEFHGSCWWDGHVLERFEPQVTKEIGERLEGLLNWR